jgi:hypothetical protein
MKNLKAKYIYPFLTLFLMASMLFSCSSDDNEGSSGTLTIDSVSKAGEGELVPTTFGSPKNVYVIQGSGFATLEKIYFNDVDTYFNPTLVTDKAIFVTIDESTPYANASNELKIVTKFGTVIYPFIIAPPAPTFGSYNPINAVAGDIITISGKYFLNPSVKIGDINATVISSSLTEIKVTVPAGLTQYKYVTVTNISGFATSTQAIGTAIYDDAPASFVENYLGPWDGSGYKVNTTEKVQGQNSIETTFTGYTGFKFPMFAAPVSTASYKALRVSFKSTKATGKFKVVLNGNFGAGKEVSFDNKWTSVVIPFSDLGGAPAEINEIVFQEFGNDNGDKIFIDDVGFVLK